MIFFLYFQRVKATGLIHSLLLEALYKVAILMTFNNQSITTSAFSSHRHWVSRFVVQEREASLALPSLFQVLF